MRKKLKVKVRSKIKKKRLALLRKIFLLLFVASSIFALGLLAKKNLTAYLKSEKFAIKEIILEGAIKTDAEELKALVGEMAKGDSIWTIDKNKLRMKVKEKYPRIKKIAVKRKFPDRIKILCAEAVPMVISINGGKRTAIDSDGREFAPTDEESEILPEVLGLDVSQIPSLSLFFKMMDEFAPEIKKEVRTVKMEGPGFRTGLGDGTDVIWGDVRNKKEFERKILCFRAVYSDSKERFGEISYIDLADLEKNKRAVVFPLNKKI